MKRIIEIEESLLAIKPKMDLGSSDWSKSEKENIEKCYFAITKVSVGFGRTVDTGCLECVQSAVNVIRNYVALVERAEEEEGITAKEPKTIDLGQAWKASIKKVEAKAKELEYKFSASAKTKEQKIAELQEFIDGIEEPDEDDLLGPEGQDGTFTKEQLIEIIKAKTGEELNADDFELQELIDIANSQEDEEASGE